MKKPVVRKENQQFDKTSVSLRKIMDFLALHPYESFTLSELAQKAEVSKSTASETVTGLEQQGYVVLKTISHLWRIQFNGQDLAAVGYKIAMSLQRIYASKLIESAIEDLGAPRAMILFGSVRKGEDAPGSDIDIAIETDSKQDLQIKGIDLLSKKHQAELKSFELMFGRTLKFHLFHRQAIDNNLFTNIANGIVLYGLLEVNP